MGRKKQRRTCAVQLRDYRPLRTSKKTVDALARMARIFRNRLYRSRFGVAGRRAERQTLQLRQLCTTLDPVGDATAVDAHTAGECRRRSFCARLRLKCRAKII